MLIQNIFWCKLYTQILELIVQLNWKIPAIALMVLFVGCSKENNNMSGELVIEDLVVGEGAEVKQYDIVNVRLLKQINRTASNNIQFSSK